MLPALSQAAGTATMNFDEATVSTELGESFDLTVQVEPGGEDLDTVRSIVTYDPETLSVQHVTLTGAFDRSAPGNYIDNGSGKVSWGAFTLDGPISTSDSFVSISFLAIQEGTATVAISSDSRAISSGSEMINTAALGSTEVTVGAKIEADPTLSLVILESDSHPDEDSWYADAVVDLNWVSIAAGSDIASYLYDFDQSPSTDPSIALSADESEMTIEVDEDGIYYFHIKGVQEDGRETSAEHFTVKVDVTVPNPIELTAQDTKLLEGESAWFTFATTDETSGVLQYQIALNSSDFQIQTSPLEMEDLDPGTYFFRVVALDRAGNAAYGSSSVRVYEEGTDIDRPENYEPASEIEAVVSALTGDDDSASSTQTLITLVLGVLIALGLIYAIAKRKKY